MEEGNIMPAMKWLKLRQDFEGSELIDFEYDDQFSLKLMSVGYDRLMEMMGKGETPRLFWQGYMYVLTEEPEYSLYTPAIFVATDKSLLTAQLFDEQINCSKNALSDCRGYGVQNGEDFILPRFEMDFRDDLVTFVWQRDAVNRLEAKLCEILSDSRYK